MTEADALQTLLFETERDMEALIERVHKVVDALEKEGNETAAILIREALESDQ